MATKLFFVSTLSDYNTGNNDAKLNGTAVGTWVCQALSTAAGTGLSGTAATPTVAGPTSGLEVAQPPSGPQPIVWYSPPLDAAVTISGSITWNIWASESSTSANVAINGRIEKVDGATGVITVIDTTARTTELSTGMAVNNFAKVPAAGVACKRGDRLRVRIFGDDAGTMGTGFTFLVDYAGPTAAADGDTWLQLTETVSFAAEPAGSQVFPTDTVSPVATAAIDKEAWTSRGGGATSIVTNTVTGFTAPIQVTDSGGGTIVDWWTRPLTAVTLGGAVRVNARGLESNASANASWRCEVAIANGDGSGVAVWATGGGGISNLSPKIATVENARSFLIAGTDVAVANGQRLRLRFYIDDVIAATGAAMTSGFTVTLVYAGAAGATGDTYLTFTQTLTDYSPRNPGVNFQNPGVL